MAGNHVQKGDVLTYTNTGEETVAAGTPVVVGDRVGVALVNIAPDESGSVAVDEVFSLDKVAGAIAQGADVYLASNAKITTTSTDNVKAGFAFRAAADAALTVDVKLNA